MESFQGSSSPAACRGAHGVADRSGPGEGLFVAAEGSPGGADGVHLLLSAVSVPNSLGPTQIVDGRQKFGWSFVLDTLVPLDRVGEDWPVLGDQLVQAQVASPFGETSKGHTHDCHHEHGRETGSRHGASGSSLHPATAPDCANHRAAPAERLKAVMAETGGELR